MNHFDKLVKKHTGSELKSKSLNIIQINLGYMCNQNCKHCHLEASPDRKEVMNWQTMEIILKILSDTGAKFIDITGGEAVLNPHFKQFISELRKQNHKIQLRTNLTGLLENDSEQLIEFLKKNKVQIVASLPCYLQENVDRERGNGIFKKCIEAIRLLNYFGYGISEDLTLNLVYNPSGDFLPPEQKQLESDYKQNLYENHSIQFNNLITITNMPLGRFNTALKKNNKEDQYINLLIQSFNPETLEGIMCKHQLSIGWDGILYDCDFNLALAKPVNHGAPYHIKDFDAESLTNRTIVTGIHCFGCTAGSGSSCSGSIVE